MVSSIVIIVGRATSMTLIICYKSTCVMYICVIHYMCKCIYIYIYASLSLYIYIYRERDLCRGGGCQVTYHIAHQRTKLNQKSASASRDVYAYIYVYTYVCMYVCIYIYIHCPINQGSTQRLQAPFSVSVAEPGATW